MDPTDWDQLKTVSEIPCSWIRSDAVRLAGLDTRYRTAVVMVAGPLSVQNPRIREGP
jgi:hypothetical protein